MHDNDTLFLYNWKQDKNLIRLKSHEYGKQFSHNVNKLAIFNNVICVSERDHRKVLVSPSEVNNIINQYHTKLSHLGIERLTGVLRERYFWSKMKQLISSIKRITLFVFLALGTFVCHSKPKQPNIIFVFVDMRV